MSEQFEVQAHVADAAFQKALIRFAAYKNKSIPEIVKAQARLMCVNLAYNTQPYGADETARFKGQNAVRRDLGRVFIGAERVKEIARIGVASGNTVSRLLLSAINAKDGAGVRRAWLRLSGKDIAVGDAPSQMWHHSQRDKRGKVRRGAKPMIVMSDSSLKSYQSMKVKLVGFAKSGWASCARLLNGTRGIPGWVSRNRGPGAVRDMSGDRDNSRVILTNNVRYIDQVLPAVEVKKALDLQRQKMTLALGHQMNAEAKAAGF